jgi:hypothetical protein
MNLGITGAELWQSQGSFSFQCSILKIPLVASKKIDEPLRETPYPPRQAGLQVEPSRLLRW